MKHLILGIALLLLSLAASLGATARVTDTVDRTLQELRLTQVALSEENLPNAATCAQTAYTQWHDRQTSTQILLPLNQTEEIDRHFARLLAAADTGDTTELQVTCAELLHLVEHLAQCEQPNLGAIL